MIKIKKSDKYSRCNSCFSEKNLKDISTLAGFSLNENSGITITLCEDCRKLLMEKIKDEFTEYGV